MVRFSTLSIRTCAFAFTLVLLAASGCAHKQKVRLDCVPKDLTIYLDKVPLKKVPDSLALRTDEPHILFFKGEGYESRMVIFEMEETADGPALTPSDMCMELSINRRRRAVSLNIEE